MDESNKMLNDKDNQLDLEMAKIDEAIARLTEKMAKTDIVEEKAADHKVADKLPARMIMTFATMFLVIASLVVCTYAYFVSETSSTGNVILAGYANVNLVNETDSPALSPDGESIRILPGYTVGKTVLVENTGTYPVYIRAKIDSVITLNEKYASRSGEIDQSLVIYNIDFAHWTKYNGYYYYNIPLEAGEVTTNLLSSIKFSEAMGNIYKDSTIKVKILLESVQSNGNGDNAFTAVGWASAGEGGAQ